MIPRSKKGCCAFICNFVSTSMYIHASGKCAGQHQESLKENMNFVPDSCNCHFSPVKQTVDRLQDRLARSASVAHALTPRPEQAATHFLARNLTTNINTSPRDQYTIEMKHDITITHLSRNIAGEDLLYECLGNGYSLSFVTTLSNERYLFPICQYTYT